MGAVSALVRIAPDGRLVARILPGPQPWATLRADGRRGDVYPDHVAYRWPAFTLDLSSSAAARVRRRRVSRETTEGL